MEQSKIYTLEDARNKKEPLAKVASLAFSEKSDHFLHLEEISFKLSDDSILTIPKGLVTDFASIPNLLKGLFSFTKFGGVPFFIHDFAYIMKLRSNEIGFKKSRLFWDKEMLIWSKAFSRSKKDIVMSYIFFYAVRIFGKHNFKSSKAKFKKI